MKIICGSNFDDEMTADRLVAENIGDEHELAVMVEALNRPLHHTDPRYYKAVPDSYTLHKFEP